MRAGEGVIDEGGRATFEKLLAFLARLDAVRAWHVLKPLRAETIAVVVTHPGQFWEVEFTAEDEIEIERFVSPGMVSHDETLLDDFTAAWRDDEADLSRLYPYPPAGHPEASAGESSVQAAEPRQDYPAFEKLLDFLEVLEEKRAWHIRTMLRPGSFAVITGHPGQYWDIEFFPDGRVEIERYVSTGVDRADDGAILEDFFAARRGDKDAVARLDLWPPYEELDAELRAEWPYVTWEEARGRHQGTSSERQDE
ncbi:MAG: hypothetical protein ACRDFX_00710 [Chloroflexota bacterium]